MRTTLFILAVAVLYQVVSVWSLREQLTQLNERIDGANIRIDICWTETAAVQDKVETALALLRFDLETVQSVLGLKNGPTQ